MKRHIPGLHQEARNGDDIPEGIFLVEIERVFYRYHPQKPFFALRLAIVEPEELAGRTLSGRPQGPVEAELVPTRLRL